MAKSRTSKSRKSSTAPATSRHRATTRATPSYRRPRHVKTSTSDSEQRDEPRVSLKHHRLPQHVKESSSDSEQSDTRISFKHHRSETEPILTLHERYPFVNIKYFRQIFWGTFRPKDSIKLSRTHVNSSPKRSQMTDLVCLIRCFEVYGQAICHYAQPDIALKLQEALSEYRTHLCYLSGICTFDSILQYHYAFTVRRMYGGQDDPAAWVAGDKICTSHRILIRKADGRPR